ncbi:MAG: hypothetical protein JW754_02505 [Candidatus Aenigmarchaeota archaeon]|nr:hypothetical protein [Candidatus Aenigmarchaeota archaeon]
MDSRGRPVNIEEIMEQVSRKYFVVPENVRAGLDFLEQRGIIEKRFDYDKRVYTFNVIHRMDSDSLIMEHPEILEGSLLE